jgi:hypothetical protein
VTSRSGINKIALCYEDVSFKDLESGENIRGTDAARKARKAIRKGELMPRHYTGISQGQVSGRSHYAMPICRPALAVAVKDEAAASVLFQYLSEHALECPRGIQVSESETALEILV